MDACPHSHHDRTCPHRTHAHTARAHRTCTPNARHAQSLSVSRCGIGDSGGLALMGALATNASLAALDVSWNALRSDAARTLAESLLQNGVRARVLSYKPGHKL